MNTKMKIVYRRRSQRGISLFELLMSVAIIGVICALALPIFGAQQDVFSEVKAKRNAQELVTECAVARAAGVDFVSAGDLDETLERIKAGARATTGAFKGREFGVRTMSAEELRETKAYLTIRNGDLAIRG
jgi:Tfp pilus assembly protein FimT